MTSKLSLSLVVWLALQSAVASADTYTIRPIRGFVATAQIGQENIDTLGNDLRDFLQPKEGTFSKAFEIPVNEDCSPGKPKEFVAAWRYEPKDQPELLTPNEAWDRAHKEQRNFAAKGRSVDVEPDFEWIQEHLDAELRGDEVGIPSCEEKVTHCIGKPFDSRWPLPQEFDWYLQRTRLRDGLEKVEATIGPNPDRITIAHFDTGYPAYAVTPGLEPGLPPYLDTSDSWDFSHECVTDACNPRANPVDVGDPGLVRTRGHGTATLALLAGGDVSVPQRELPRYAGPLGGARFARVVEYRIADFVAVWNGRRVTRALEQAVSKKVDVISMSMGGPPSLSMPRAVNHAYCNGVAMVTAAANHFDWWVIPNVSPATTVYPARYTRVVSAVGVTADEESYVRAPRVWSDWFAFWRFTMVGNAGPLSVMDEAVAAWTPNVPWLAMLDKRAKDERGVIHLHGGGTSAATPQVAAAAAQWLQYHRTDLEQSGHWRGWQKAEAAMTAVLNISSKEDPLFGRGFLDLEPGAAAAESTAPPKGDLRLALVGEDAPRENAGSFPRSHCYRARSARDRLRRARSGSGNRGSGA